MTHYAFAWHTEKRDDDREQIVVDVRVGPAPQKARLAGSLVMSPSEINALDRLLHAGAAALKSDDTYIIGPDQVRRP